jgi:putative sugar O-methyltransferase
MPAFSKSFFPVMDFVLSRLPWRVRRQLVGGSGKLLADMLVHGGSAGLLKHANTLGLRGKWTREEPDSGPNGAELARTLGAIWLRMKKQQSTVSPAYLPAATWGSILDSEWSGPRAALEAGDLTTFETFLRNCFRNGGISGLWGDRRMFEEFAAQSGGSALQRLALFVQQFETWRREVSQANLDDLDEPRVGNPWGYDIDGRLVVEPSFEYHALALRIRELVADVARPVVLEIGGGFGGLARQILRLIPGIRYIGLDLPENVIIQSWYLSRSLGDRRIAVDDVSRANQEGLGDLDALILPNWTLPQLRLSQLHVVINVHSFGEMSRNTLDSYFAEIMRMRPEWIFHDNLGSPRRDDVYGISSTEYPALDGYRLIASSESRWPRYNHRSAYPCRENLFRFGAANRRADAVG